MARKKPNLNEILKIINDNHQCVFIQDVYQSIAVSATTFYKWFPTDSSDRQVIDDALEHNKVQMKQAIRDRLLESKNSAALIALYKLIGTKEERQILSSSNQSGSDVSISSKNDDIELVIN